MFKSSFVFGLTFLFLSHSFSQTKDSLVFTKELSKDLFSFLKKGFNTYEVMNGVKADPRLNKLSKKLNASLKKNYDWYVEQVAKIPEGETLPYHENLGLTPEEYREFLSLADNITMVSTGRISTIISQVKDHNAISIRFPATGLVNTDGPFSVTLRDSTAYYNEIQLSYAGIITVDDDNNGLRSKWAGHSFIYEMPKGLSLEDLKDPGTLNYHSCKITVALLERPNKVMISFKEKKFVNGLKTIDIDMPLVYSDNQNIVIK